MLAFFLWLAVFISAAPAQQLPDGTVGLFQGSNATGPRQDIPPGTYAVKASTLGAANGKTGGYSVRVPAGYMIKFCENSGTANEGGGVCEEFGEGMHDLRSETPVAYIKVWKMAAAAPAPRWPRRPC